MDDHHVIKIVNATCVLHNYLCTANMDVANVMARSNPQGAAYMQPTGYATRSKECWIPFKETCTKSPKHLQGLLQLTVWCCGMAGK